MCAKSFTGDVCLSFLIEDDKLLEKYNKIWDTFSNSIRKEFDSKPTLCLKYLTTKIKSYKSKTKTFFYNGKIPKRGSDCICLSLIFIDSIVKKMGTIILEYFKGNVTTMLKKKTNIYIKGELQTYFDESDKEVSDKESLNALNCFDSVNVLGFLNAAYSKRYSFLC